MGEKSTKARPLTPFWLPACASLASYVPGTDPGLCGVKPIAFRIFSDEWPHPVDVCAEHLPRELHRLNGYAVTGRSALPTVARVTYLPDRNAAAYGRTEYIEVLEPVPNVVQFPLF